MDSRTMVPTTAMQPLIFTPDAEKIAKVFLKKEGFLTDSFESDYKCQFSKKRPRWRHKSVTFSNLLDVHVQEYSEEDLDSSWYSKSDYISFANECKRVLKETDAVVGEVQKINTALYCVRGLEDQIIPSVSRMKRDRKRSLIKMIVWHHKIHKIEHPNGPSSESLRELSTMLSSRSRRWARELGVLDAN